MVLDPELQKLKRVSHGNAELLVPLGILGVGHHAGAGEGALGDGDSDVRVAGDDFGVVVDDFLIAVAVGGAVTSVSVVVVIF